MTRRAPPDQAEREAAIFARGVNVVADAGAGTGKTTLLVARLVELVAPSDGGEALPLSRIAAITFTRKAAGELKLRIREALLEALAAPALAPARRERLSAALGELDTAHVGTIHAFADRLLRLHPVEARLGPAWEIVEDAGALVRETFEVLLQAVETGTLAEVLAGRVDPAVAAEAEAAIVDALSAGLRAETRELEHASRAGLDDLFARLLETRDVPPRVPAPRRPDRARFGALVDELAALVARCRGDGVGQRFLAATVARLEELRAEERPERVLAGLLRLCRAEPRMRKGQELGGEEAAWIAWKAYDGDTRREPVRRTALRDDLLRPYAGWMARRLVRCAPAVVAAYEQMKARHGAVDQVDLLLRLRDLLRDHPAVRADLQARFDHLLVDEFQDTDPLQAEIVLFLCEAGARASSWRDVALAPGKLTVVGDPKQSIYRFRRADIAVYAAVRDLVARGPHRVARLSANFRSHPGLIAFFASRFDALLGRAEPGRPAFDPEAGAVANEPLLAGVEGEPAARVLLLPLAAGDARKGSLRAAEARAVAAWLRRLLATGERRVRDPDGGGERPARPGDVAILASSTFNLPLLFAELDRLSVPYAARGGALFLRDPLHRQFLLALRALADREDGVAAAALLRAPFFALDVEDLARARAAGEAASSHPGVLRARAALALVQDLRRRRLGRPPGDTARDLLERTALARAAALGPNGAQRLEALRELCLALDALAAGEGLDFDAATARLRGWATDPVALDPPRPVAGGAVEVLTVHQAKGLEFPVVILWDACAELVARDVRGTFVVDRDGEAWALDLDGLRWNEPEGTDVAARERRYLDAERRRLVYVAATRARDLLVLPVAGEADPRFVTGALAAGAPPELVEVAEAYAVGAEPAWAREAPAPAPRPPGDAAALAAEVDAAWGEAAAGAALPRFAPSSVTAEAHREEEDRPGEAGRARPVRESRFGPVFGDAVHRAIGLALREPGLLPAAAVERAARVTGLAARRAEAAEDVGRALEALARAGLRRAPGRDLQLEYPVALAEGGRLIAGYVDLLAAADGGLAVVDFKTDAPPPGDVQATHAAYVEQVRGYARILEALGLAPAGAVRAGLLFTAERENPLGPARVSRGRPDRDAPRRPGPAFLSPRRPTPRR